jgi:hypothetical protein
MTSEHERVAVRANGLQIDHALLYHQPNTKVETSVSAPTIALGSLERVEPRTLWQSESRDFTPWLADNLGLLGNAISLDLELVSREVRVGAFACDIQAQEPGSGRRVIIENQLEATDHSHLGQLLTYAAGLDAAVVVWIAPIIRDEHREAIDFLNRHTREGIDFFAVALEIVRIGASAPAVVFRLAASPNAWAKRTSILAEQPAASPKGLAYQAFFQILVDEMRETYRFTNARSVGAGSWFAFSAGVSGIVFSPAFGIGNMRVDLYIDVGEAARNKAIYDALAEQKIEIETHLSEVLTWQRLGAKRASRISAVQAGVKVEDAAQRGAEMRQWMVTRLLKFREVFGPRLRDAVRTIDLPDLDAPSDNGPPP